MANSIVTENQKTGTSAWALTKPATNREIEGYASLSSVNRGGTIKLFVNTSESVYTINIYRMGWYGGLGGRLVAGPISRTGTSQVIPQPDSNGTVDCNWVNPYTLTIPGTADPTDWCSGYYLAKLTSGTTGSQAYILFVVRDDSRASQLLAQSSVNTFQAYNTWGGKTLYTFQSPSGRANKVSFNRPYALNSNPQMAIGNGAAEFLIGSDGGPPGGWEYCMVRFLEREGYDVTYCTDVDTHANPNLLRSHKGFLSVGHNEYWSLEMRQNVTAARDAGVSLGFFSANACYWQVRLEPSQATGDPNRIVTCYKYYPTDYIGTDTQDPYYLDSDPSNDNQITVRFRDTLAGSSRVASPEESLIGIMYDYGADDANNDLVVTNASHWVYANTGLNNGDHIQYIVGYECDRSQGNGPAGVTILAHSPYTGNTFTGSGFSDVSVYTTPSGATVFATGSIQFAWALDDFMVPSLRFTRLSAAAQQMTRNVLNRFTGGGTTLQPVVADTGGPYSAAPGFAIAFNAANSTIPVGTTPSYAWNFGDGTTGTGVAPTHAYAAPGSYTVALTVSDNKGNSSTSQTTATITGGNRYAQVTADSVFDLTSDKRYYYPAFAVGDGIIPVPTEQDRFNQWFATSNQPLETNGVLDTPISLYMTLPSRQTLNKVWIYQASWFDFPGFHTKDVNVYVRTTGADWIKVASGTLQNSNAALTELTFPNTLADEARIETLSTYDTALYKSVGLSEVQFFGAGAQQPLASTGGPYSGEPGKLIAFNASGSSAPAGSIASYNWNFGDGSTGTGVNPTHAYTATGIYTVTLTIADNTGATTSATTTVTIRGRYASVTADATFDTTSDKRYYYPPENVGDYVVPVPAPEDQFKQWLAPISQPMDATGVLTTPLNVYMNFFAAQTVNSVLINQAAWYDNLAFHTKAFNVYLHAPTAPAGTWTKVASGTLTNTNGAMTTINFAAALADQARIEIVSSYDTTSYNSVGLSEVEFVAVGNVPPVANAGGPYTGIVGQPLTLDGTGSTDKDNNLASYSWNFGDGTTAGTGATPAHIYKAAGTYTVTLTVTDALGATASATTTATIKPPIDLSGLTVSPTSVTGGATNVTITGTVTLSGAAPTGGVTITLSDNSAAVTVPTSVVVPEGATSAPFTITTIAVSADTTATITATFATTSTAKTATLAVKAPVVTTLTLNPTSVTSGTNATGTVTLTGPAPTGGTTVTLTSGNASAKAPANVVVPAGQTSATFTITTTAVSTATTASITAATGSTSQAATLTINPPSFTLTVAPTSVTGGTNATGTVTLSSAAPTGGATITLSDNSASATIPASVVVPAGATSVTFTITTSRVTADTTVTLTATYGSASKTAPLTVKAPTVTGLTLNPSTVMGGSSTTGTITISGPAPTGGLTVAVSDNSANSQVPASVVVPAGATSANFTITTSTVTSQGSALVTASANGSSQSATLTIKTSGVSSVTLNPATVTGGNSSTGTVTLNGPAPTGGAKVVLRSGNSAAQVAASVTVPAGQSSAPFTITTSRGTSTKQAVISASYAGTTQSATLTVKPIALTSLTLSPSSVKGGTNFTGTLAIDTPAPSGGLTVNIAVVIDGQTYTGTVTVPQGQTSISQAYSTYPTTSSVTITVKATLYESSKSGNVTITP